MRATPSNRSVTHRLKAGERQPIDAGREQDDGHHGAQYVRAPVGLDLGRSQQDRRKGGQQVTGADVIRRRPELRSEDRSGECGGGSRS